MKKVFLLSIAIIFISSISFAQSVGISNDGTVPNPSAMLDVNSATKGMLIPRVMLTGTDDVTTISSPAISLLVYNTSAVSGANAVIPGYYYWNGSSWLILTTGVSEFKKDNIDSISNTGYATVYSRNKARDSVQANLNEKAANILSKKENVDSVGDAGYATVYSRNKARDSVQTNLNVYTANILLKKDNIDSVADAGYATVYSRNKARDSVQANLNINTTNILLKKDNIDSIADAGYATVYSRNKARDSVQANLNINTAGILLKKDNSDSSNPVTGYTTLYQNSLKEAPLTFAAGLTRTGNTITNNLSTGVSGGQTLVGSTLPNSGITYVATSGASTGITGADHIFKVGDNGSIEAMRIVSDSLGYVGIGTSKPTTVLHIKKNLPAPGHNTVLKIENAYGAGNFGFNNFGAYWQNSLVNSGFAGGFTIYSYQQTGYFGISGAGNVGIGLTNANAFLQIKAGTAGTAPFKLTSGTLLSSPQAGAIEFNNDTYYATISTGAARRTFAFLESPTFTGTVGGITKNMVGLGNVDNTSDVNKPISTASQTALNLKWGLTGNTGTNASINFIGTTDNVPFSIRVNNQNAGRIDNALSNTFWGYQAGTINTTGTGNTAIGANTLQANINGSSNTAVGSGANVSTDGLINATALGSGAIADASNKVRLGNTSVTVIEGQVAYSFPSDARFKYNIQPNVPGLAFIKKLVPVTYYFDADKLAEYTRTGIISNSIARHASYKEEKQLHTGFLAQDVERIATELGYNFDGVHVPENNKDHYSLAYSQFIMPLVKSVQEQQQIIEDQNKKLDKQEDQIKKMNEQIEMLTKSIKALDNTSPK